MLQINRTPDVVIGPPEDPYMRRWWLKKDGQGDLYIHQICRSDDERALHDHRADNQSIVLFGEYTEIYAPEEEGAPWNGYNLFDQEERILKAGDEQFRKAEQPHRLVLHDGPVWTLWRKFGDRRDWGFWVPHYEYYDFGSDRISRLEDFNWMQWEAYVAQFGESLFR